MNAQARLQPHGIAHAPYPLLLKRIARRVDVHLVSARSLRLSVETAQSVPRPQIRHDLDSLASPPPPHKQP